MQITLLTDHRFNSGWDTVHGRKGGVYIVPDSIAVHLINKKVARVATGDEILTNEMEKV